MGDMHLAERNDQVSFNHFISQLASRLGLKVKTLQQEQELLPSKCLENLASLFHSHLGTLVGFHFHRRHDFMRDVIAKKKNPLSFHYNWNKNKLEKRQFLEQMADWYVSDSCNASLESCCVANPVATCHFQDQPSVIPCKNASTFKPGPSFW
jgi:hypothetical protein